LVLVSQQTLFTEKQNQMAVIAKAFGHPARIAIIEHLLKPIRASPMIL